MVFREKTLKIANTYRMVSIGVISLLQSVKCLYLLVATLIRKLTYFPLHKFLRIVT